MATPDYNKTSPSFTRFDPKTTDRAVIGKRASTEPAQARFINKHWTYDAACWPTPNHLDRWFAAPFSFVARDPLHALPAGTYTFTFSDGVQVNATFTSFTTPALITRTPNIGGVTTRQYDWTTDNLFGYTLLSVNDSLGNYYGFATSLVNVTHRVAPHGTGAADPTPATIFIDVYPAGNSPNQAVYQVRLDEVGKLLGRDFSADDKDTRYTAYGAFTRVDTAPGYANLLGGHDNIASVYSPATGTYTVSYQNHFKPTGPNYSGTGSRVMAHLAHLAVTKSDDDLNTQPYHYMLTGTGSNFHGSLSNNSQVTFVIGSTSFGTNVTPNDFEIAEVFCMAKNFSFAAGLNLTQGTEGQQTNPLTWTSVPGATAYNLYRSTAAPAPGLTANNLLYSGALTAYNDTSYLHGGSNTYNYQVIANTPTGNVASNNVFFHSAF